MCLQDVQLARASDMRITSVVFGGAGTQQVLLPDESRFGFVVLGPSTGNLDIRIGDQTAQFTAQRVLVTSSVDVRRFMLRDYGRIITRGVWLTESAAATAVVVEYILPTDPKSLELLAKLGMW